MTKHFLSIVVDGEDPLDIVFKVEDILEKFKHGYISGVGWKYITKEEKKNGI